MRTRALAVAALTLFSFNASAQTNASNASAVGTWELDLAKSNFGSETPPKSMTLVILKDTPQEHSWRLDSVDDKGQASSFSWRGPQDGSLHPARDPKGQVIGQEGLKRDKDGSLLRHGTDDSGVSFEARATLSPDGNTITDVATFKTPDGKAVTMTAVYHRVVARK